MSSTCLNLSKFAHCFFTKPLSSTAKVSSALEIVDYSFGSISLDWQTFLQNITTKILEVFLMNGLVHCLMLQGEKSQQKSAAMLDLSMYGYRSPSISIPMTHCFK